MHDWMTFLEDAESMRNPVWLKQTATAIAAAVVTAVNLLLVSLGSMAQDVRCVQRKLLTQLAELVS